MRLSYRTKSPLTLINNIWLLSLVGEGTIDIRVCADDTVVILGKRLPQILIVKGHFAEVVKVTSFIQIVVLRSASSKI